MKARVIESLLRQLDALKNENANLKRPSAGASLAVLQQTTEGYLEHIDAQRARCVDTTEIARESLPKFIEKRVGKVRDQYICEDVVVMIATDRQSAFDRHLTSVPFKGQVLNLTSKWWFEKTEHIIPNHLLATPKANTSIGRKCTVFSIEFVMRSYMTGSTGTSIWKNYEKGVRKYCGHDLPEGFVKNQKLWANLLTPTTKDDEHDELISAEEVVARGIMSQADWDVCATAAAQLFAFGQEEAAKRGLILVDTKYEFGKDSAGTILLVDEIHTPDSSRYWIAESYERRMAAGEAPENVDKEFLRLWFREHCDPYKDEVIPDAPVELVNELSRRYILLYEMITGESFGQQFTEDHGHLEDALADYFASV